MLMLERIKLMLGLADTTKDSLIAMLAEDAIVEVTDYCNMAVYDVKLDSTVAKMVIQNYNRVKVQGISSQSFSGVSESYVNGYTIDIMNVLNKNRRVRFL